MLYKIMQLKVIDKKHVYIDLWNEKRKSDIVLQLSFTTQQKLYTFYDILNNQTEFLTTVKDITNLYTRVVTGGNL